MHYRIIVFYNQADSGRLDDDDTLITAKEVAHVLKQLQHEVVLQPFYKDLMEIDIAIAQHVPDLVFNLVESFRGSDCYAYLIAERIAAYDIPYTGNAYSVLHQVANKLEVKRHLLPAGLPTPAYYSLEDPIAVECLHSVAAVTRFIVKSVSEHASLGIDAASVVSGGQAAVAQIKRLQAQNGGDWFAEEYIEGREINVSMIGSREQPEVLPIAEIEFNHYATDMPKIVDYAAKWQADSFASQNTVRRFCDRPEDASLIQHLQAISLQCWRLYSMQGYTRIDFRVDAQQQPWIIDINANPALAQDAGFIAAALRQGYTQQTVITKLLDIAMQRQNEMAHHVDV